MVGLVAPLGEVLEEGESDLSDGMFEGDDGVMPVDSVPLVVGSGFPNSLCSFAFARAANEGDEGSSARELVEPGRPELFTAGEGAASGALLVSAAVPVVVEVDELVDAPLPMFVA